MVGLRHLPLAVALGVASISACSSGAPRAAPATTVAAAATSTLPAPTTPAPTTTGTIPGEAEGARVFRSQCAGCHGPRGEGNLGPALVGIAQRLPVEDELTIVRQGQGRMPPFAPALSDADIAAVVDYSRTQLG